MTVTCQETEILAWCTNFWTIQKDIGTEGNVSYQMSFNERKNLEENFIPKTQSLPPPPCRTPPPPPIFPGDSIEKWQLFFYYYHSYYWTLTVGELLPKLSDFFAVSHFEKLGTDRTAVENTGFSWNGRLNFAFLWRQERSRTNEKWMLGENWRVSQNSGMKIKITALSVRCTFFFLLFVKKKTDHLTFLSPFGRHIPARKRLSYLK